MKKHLALRWCLLAIGIVVMAAGIVIVTKSATGNTPISSTGYVLNVAFPSVSYGVFMFFWNILLLLGQVVILRRRFQPLALLQIPISVLFSLSIDAFAWLLAWFTPANYAESLGMLALGIVALAAGVSCTVVANVAMNCGEALVAAITSNTGWNFGHTKVGFDISCVIIACVVSLITMGHVTGVREGTVAAAVITGFVVNFFVRLMGGPCPPLKTGSKEQRAATRKKHLA
ncbi:YczE/YyaS/YitT family protein [Senegalimassilia anaerobia]|uniref:YczE/YyaS/YitT family protein n=1 Tax=Senegalimassilia anaerobia TaxID=1473216 RepID=UPI003A8F82DF